MNRIAVIGCSGSGKSVLARQMGARLDLPVHHLDRLYWKPGWVRPAPDDWVGIQEDLVSGERWILDGNYGGTLQIRLEACDTAVFLALSRYHCLFRVIKRSLVDWGKLRPDLNSGCPDQLPDWEWIRWIWNYPNASEPRVLEKIDAAGVPQVIILRTPKQVRDFLADLPT
jgi:adenylate kinase family enzyme